MGDSNWQKWVKSSYSFSNGNCVEVRQGPGTVSLRDSKDRSGPVLKFSGSTWGVFVASLKAAS